MKTIHVDASKKYDVMIGNGILDSAGELCKEAIGVSRGVIITDSNVDVLYSKRLEASLSSVGFEIKKYVFEAGEKSKNTATLVDILEFLADDELTRCDCIFALGGGVVGDISGFAASVYLRGIKFVQIPTTLLAAVDSSVGGKTGVDLKAGKNLAGAFHQPSLVICDPLLLNTLAPEIFADGMAEVIKYGVINDKVLFDTLKNGVKDNIEEIIASCVENKSKIVKADEFDTGMRQLLNLGHTIGHSIEKLSNFSISHGSAVAIGMVIITRAAVAQGLCDVTALDELISLIQKTGLPTECPFLAGELAAVALSDKKRQRDTINLVVPYAIGDTRLLTISVDELEAFISKGLK